MKGIVVKIKGSAYRVFMRLYFAKNGPKEQNIRFGQCFVNAFLLALPPEQTKYLFYEADISKCMEYIDNVFIDWEK